MTLKNWMILQVLVLLRRVVLGGEGSDLCGDGGELISGDEYECFLARWLGGGDPPQGK